MKKSLISNKLKTLLDNAANVELFNSYLYRHLSNWAQQIGYFGAQKAFASEADEEIKHYQHVVDFLNDSGVIVSSTSIEAPEDNPDSLYDAVVAAYNQEVFTENVYRKIAEQSCDDDYVVYEFALSVLKHQRKSVGEYADLLARLELVKDDSCGVLMIDKEMGA